MSRSKGLFDKYWKSPETVAREDQEARQDKKDCARLVEDTYRVLQRSFARGYVQGDVEAKDVSKAAVKCASDVLSRDDITLIDGRYWGGSESVTWVTVKYDKK